MWIRTFLGTSFEILLIPKCCQQYHWSNFFTSEESLSLLRKSIFFGCPNCSKIYKSSNKLLSSFGFLNLALKRYNSRLNENKKTGFQAGAIIPENTDKILREIFNNTLYEEGIIEFDLHSALVLAGSESNKKQKVISIAAGQELESLYYSCKSCNTGPELCPEQYFVSSRYSG